MHVNAKRIMGMMRMALMNGESVVVNAERADEQTVVEAVEAFFLASNNRE